MIKYKQLQTINILNVIIVAMTILTLADGSVLQTGQVKSYTEDGSIVTDGSLKDDGYYQAGKVRSYSRSGDVVKDNATGLKWQDNESIQKRWVTQENYDDGNYSDTSGDTATTYCEETLVLEGHNDWRLPSIQELQTLVDNSQYHSSVTQEVFEHISPSYHWSSTTFFGDVRLARGVYFNDGHSNFFIKSNNFYVRCVRGALLAPSNLSRSADIVSDNTTGLQWQDNSAASSTYVTWTEAINYCEKTLDLGGYDDWRLPNQNELFSIVEYTQNGPTINSLFQNIIESLYWSSSSSANQTAKAWNISFLYGNSDSRDKADDFYVRCVRGGLVSIPANPSIIMYLLD